MGAVVGRLQQKCVNVHSHRSFRGPGKKNGVDRRFFPSPQTTTLVHTLACLAPVVPTGQHRSHARWSRKRLTNTTEARSNPTERACVPATTASAMPACCAWGESCGSEGGAHAGGAPCGAGGCSARHVLSPHPSPQRAAPRRKGGAGRRTLRGSQSRAVLPPLGGGRRPGPH